MAVPRRSRRSIVRGDASWPLLLIATTAYTVLTSRWVLRNHDGVGTLGFDFGMHDQGVWLLSRGHRPFVTIIGRHLFGDRHMGCHGSTEPSSVRELADLNLAIIKSNDLHPFEPRQSPAPNRHAQGGDHR